MQYRDGTLGNPGTGRHDPVRLRSYVNDDALPSGFVGPSIVARPGDTLRVRLSNALPAEDPSCEAHPSNINISQCFNSTNLHTHGFWVSPAGNSDNVFLTLRPGVSFEYEYNIPADHPAGKFWYHPHLHGSTALQVASGMVGALILRGDHMPAADRAGDLDVLLKPMAAQPFGDWVMVLEQIAYACRDAEGRIKPDPADDDNGLWVCDEGAVEDWVLSSDWEGHPHHIHVNAFQIAEVLDPDGRDVSAPGIVDDFTGEADPQFAGIKGLWKDTIWVKNPRKSPDETYTIRVRTQYRPYVGSFVFHCHILDHEDQRMMQTV